MVGSFSLTWESVELRRDIGASLVCHAWIRVKVIQGNSYNGACLSLNCTLFDGISAMANMRVMLVGGSKTGRGRMMGKASSVVGGKPNSYQWTCQPVHIRKDQMRAVDAHCQSSQLLGKPQKLHTLPEDMKASWAESPAAFLLEDLSITCVLSTPLYISALPLLACEHLQQEPRLLHLQEQIQNASRMSSFMKKRQQCRIIPKQNVEIFLFLQDSLVPFSGNITIYNN